MRCGKKACSYSSVGDVAGTDRYFLCDSSLIPHTGIAVDFGRNYRSFAIGGGREQALWVPGVRYGMRHVYLKDGPQLNDDRAGYPKASQGGTNNFLILYADGGSWHAMAWAYIAPTTRLEDGALTFGGAGWAVTIAGVRLDLLQRAFATRSVGSVGKSSTIDSTVSDGIQISAVRCIYEGEDRPPKFAGFNLCAGGWQLLVDGENLHELFDGTAKGHLYFVSAAQGISSTISATVSKVAVEESQPPQ